MAEISTGELAGNDGESSNLSTHIFSSLSLYIHIYLYTNLEKYIHEIKDLKVLGWDFTRSDHEYIFPTSHYFLFSYFVLFITSRDERDS